MNTPAPRWKVGLVRAGYVGAGLVLGALVFGEPGGPSSSTNATQDGAHAHAHADEWTCSMHPQVRQPELGQCPICGMDLIPAAQLDDDDNNDDKDGVEVETHVRLSPRARALAKLRTTLVRRASDPSVELRLLGQLEPDESARRVVTSWTAGRIDRLAVRETGQRVRAGQVIATLYSPEVFAAHKDLLVARDQLAGLETDHPSYRAGVALLRAARERLRLIGVPDDVLATLEEADQPARAVDIRTPFSGTVLERIATEGQYVDVGTPLYRIADLRRLWVQLEAYEEDLPRLRLGQNVSLVVEGLEGKGFAGRVRFLDPTVDPRTRTTQVRVEVRNPKGQLRPGMFATAVVEAASKQAEGEPPPLVVPRTAPLFTGRRALVYVEVEAYDRPRYEARNVTLGARRGEVYPVLDGLLEGERVVVQGAFVLDADLQLKGGASMMGADESEVADNKADETAATLAQVRGRFRALVENYLTLQEALADDALPNAIEAARKMRTQASTVDLSDEPLASANFAALKRTLLEQGDRLVTAGSLDDARLAFEPVSRAMAELLERFGNPTEVELQLSFCPMAIGNQGAHWVQRKGDIDNAYFGARMLRCGESRAAASPGTLLLPPKRER